MVVVMTMMMTMITSQSLLCLWQLNKSDVVLQVNIGWAAVMFDVLLSTLGVRGPQMRMTMMMMKTAVSDV